MASELFEPTLDLILDAGQTLLENGGEVFRAQQTMEIMAHSLGVEEFHVYVLTNGIFASARPAGGTSISMVRHVPRVSIHLGRVEAVNELSRELAAGQLDMIQARRKLADARAIGDTPWPDCWSPLSASGLASGGSTVFSPTLWQPVCARCGRWASVAWFPCWM